MFNKQMNVLIVDDQQNMRELAKYALRQIGFTSLIEAPDGAAAFRKLEQFEIGLIISDMHMQPIDGYSLLRVVRNDERFAHIPFLMVTADSVSENVRKAGEAGVNHYVVKPFTVQTLGAAIEHVFQNLKTA